MSDHREDRVDALLSGGRLSGAARDQIFKGALAQAGIKRRRRAPLVWLGSLALSAAALLLFLRPSGFGVRGGGGPVIDLGCRDGRLEACPESSILLIRVSGVRAPSYLAAWAEPAGPGERIWYFPGADGKTPALSIDSGTQVLPEGVRPGPVGHYRVHVLLSSRLLTRAELLAARRDAFPAATELNLEVVP